MIIILGPNQAGKSTLAHKLRELSGKQVYHFTRESTYSLYLKHLCSLDLLTGICDRMWICDLPYSLALKRDLLFTKQQLANLTRLTLIQAPLIVLATRKHTPYTDDHVPEELWDTILGHYYAMLRENGMPFIRYDYEVLGDDPSVLLDLESMNLTRVSWWAPMWRSGYGCVGSPHPKVLLVAERLGPNNINLLPFEAGPTADLLCEMLHYLNTRLGVSSMDYAITNMVKDVRKSTREPNEQDLELLRTELASLKPAGVLFMGKTAQAGIPVAKSMGIAYEEIPHLGYLHHKRADDRARARYYEVVARAWRNLTEPESAKPASEMTFQPVY